MSVLLAAVDDSAAARPVLAVARELARLMGAEVEAACVDELGETATAEAMTRAARVPRSPPLRRDRRRDRFARVRARCRRGGARCARVAVRCVACRSRDARTRAVARRARGRRPAPGIRLGRSSECSSRSKVTARATRSVTSYATWRTVRHSTSWRSMCSNRNGCRSSETSPCSRRRPGPRSSDGARCAADRGDVRVEARVGMPPRAVCRAARELDVDLVVVAWHRNLGGGHGRIVRELLAESEVPVLLVPIPRPAADAR